MTRCSRLAALVVMLVSPAFAWAHGFLGPGRSTTSYYVPVQIVPIVYCVQPVYTVPSYNPGTPPPPLVPGQAPAKLPASRSNTAYATPTAAPPSSGTASGEPPLAGSGKRRPVVSESRSYYDAYAVAVQDPAKQFGERCTITFWNLTAKPLTIKVDGRDQTLQPRQNLAVDVPRRFAWQVDERGENKENIAMGEGGLEIVIRR
jgi:hypothetical protein